MRHIATIAGLLAVLGVAVAGCDGKAADKMKKKANAAANKAADKAADAAVDKATEAVTGEGEGEGEDEGTGEGEGEMVSFKCAMDGCDKTKEGKAGDKAPSCCGKDMVPGS